MTNAAAELLRIFRLWNEQPKSQHITAAQHRASVAKNEFDMTLYEMQAHAFELYLECLQYLDELAAAGVGVAHLGPEVQKSWIRGVILPDVAWNTSNSGRATSVEVSNLLLLEGLASQYDQFALSHGGRTVNVEAIEALCDEVDELLQDPELPVMLRKYVSTFLHGVRTALTSENPWEIVKSVTALLGALQAVASTEPSKGWAKKAKKVGEQLAIGVASSSFVESVKYAGFLAGS